MKTVSIDEIKEKFYNKLKKSGWDHPLRGFIFSKEFEDIIKTLYSQSMNGNKFTPVLKNIFQAFELCPYKDLKVVMIGQDPYPQIGVADGIAFSCGITREKQPSLEYLLQEVNHTVYDDNNYSTDPDLARWCEQGILMLNTALTTTVGKIGQHYVLWEPFLAYLFDTLNWNNNGLIYVYMGKKAQEWSNAVSDNNYKFKITHPAIAYYNNGAWDSQNVFVEIKDILKKNFNFEIEW
jgi:uracil-DNA glycosylase